MKHLVLPDVVLEKRILLPTYSAYLNEWRETAISLADAGDVAASTCLEGAFTELVSNGALTHDWLGILDEHLSGRDAMPLAYSRAFGKRLFGFDDQYLQSSVAAIHTRWWIECIVRGPSRVDHTRFARLIKAKVDTSSSLIFDHDISPTVLRHRMRTELTMSMAMGVEILGAANALSHPLQENLAASISDPKKCPPSPYVSTEYFRSIALTALGFPQLFPVEIEKRIAECTTGLDVGYCDFPMSSKYDAYMGTVKRTSRDKPIHSPLSALQVRALLPHVADSAQRNAIETRLRNYAAHLKAHPQDIPAFKMRDVQIPFGVGITPIEAICATELIDQC